MRGWSALIASTALLSAAQPSLAQSWSFEARRDPFTDRTVFRAHSTTRTRSLNIRCQDDRLEAYLVIVGYLGDYAGVRYRFDRGAVSERSWDVSTDKSAAFAYGPGEFARQAMAGSVLNFEIEGEYGAPDRYQITLAGSSGPIGRVLDACGIPRTEAYREGGSVWRRVVEDLESVDRVEVQAVASLLSRIEQYDGPIDGVRRPALYEALSHFYAIYWSGCLQGTALSGACRRWLDRRRYDETADYTLEPIALLVELMSEPPPAEAAPATPRPSVVTNPQWATPPEPEFPERATERGVTEAHVVLSCSASANGRVTDCSIIAEEPPGLGFGREAIAAARRATLSPRQVDGMAASARVTFPVTFTAPTTS